MNLKIKITSLLLSICFSVGYSQTAKEIIAKNIENTGGLTNWKRLNTVRLSGKLILGIKENYPLTILQARPNLARTIIKNAGKEVTLEGYDGKKGYAMNYASGQLQEYKNYVPESFDSDFIEYENKGFEAKLLGKETLGKHTVYKVELTKNVNKTIYYFDSQEYMLLKEDKAGEVFEYSDFKKVGNYVFPFRIEGTSAKKEHDFVMIFNKIEVNTVFDAKTFAF